MKKITFLVSLLFVGFLLHAQNFRPPAYPLITVDPYFSVWSFNDTLNEASTVHWTGKKNSLQGIIRVDGKSYYFLGQPIANIKTVLPLTGESRKWRFTTTRPSGKWYKQHYDDQSWKQTEGAFSNGDDKAAPNKWDSKDLWVRRHFQLKSTTFDQLRLKLHHDDNIKVYLNGVPAFEKEGWNNAPGTFPIRKQAIKALKKGENVMAIHIKNTTGGAYLDAGLVDKVKPAYSFEKANQISDRITATQTFYEFRAGGVLLDLRFTAPLLPDDLDLLSRPADYVSFKVHSADHQSHDVQVYFSAAGNMAVNTPDQKVTWQRDKAKGLDLMRVGTTSQDVLGRTGDDVRIDWGYLYLGASKGKQTSTAIAASDASVQQFVKTGALQMKDDKNKPRPAGEQPVTLAVSYDLGKIQSKPKDRHIILAYDELDAIEYFHKKLKPWWKRKGMSTKTMLGKAEKEYAQVLKKCDQFDQKLRATTLASGGEKYAKICELAYRQSVAAHKLVEGPKGKPLFFSKENFSNGSIGTVDITYPSSPLYLYYRPELLKGMMRPILYYSESGQYDHPFAAHDVGTYPVANGMTYGEPMPVEETGNMLILAAAVTKADDNASFAKAHWQQLSIWAHYLKSNGLDPANQLCTDDFAGHLAHNANLSIKAIMGLAAYGYIAHKMGMQDTGTAYTQLARKYAREWMKMDADGDHYSLTFDKKGTWSQKYNLVWDKVLDLGIFPKSVAQKELKYYMTKQTKYGIPLDSRATYTKADWILWTATLADNAKTFHAFMDPVYRYINETPTRVPLSDWYQTTDATQVGFQARSVVGAFFIKALYDKWNK